MTIGMTSWSVSCSCCECSVCCYEYRSHQPTHFQLFKCIGRHFVCHKSTHINIKFNETIWQIHVRVRQLQPKMHYLWCRPTSKYSNTALQLDPLGHEGPFELVCQSTTSPAPWVSLERPRKWWCRLCYFAISRQFISAKKGIKGLSFSRFKTNLKNIQGVVLNFLAPRRAPRSEPWNFKTV